MSLWVVPILLWVLVIGTGWYWVKDALAQIVVELKLAHAKGVKAITSAKVKTDATDPLMLAQTPPTSFG